MDMWNVLAGGAAVGVIASCWSKIKDVAWRICSLFIQQIEIASESGHDALVAYLVANYPRSRLYDRMYGANCEHHRDGRYGLVPYEMFGSRSVDLLERLVAVHVQQRAGKEGRSTADTKGEGSGSDAAKVYSTITFLRGTLDVEEILRNACAAGNRLSWAVANESRKKRRTASSSTTCRRAATGRRSRRHRPTAWRGISRATTACWPTRRSSSARRHCTTAAHSRT